MDLAVRLVPVLMATILSLLTFQTHGANSQTITSEELDRVFSAIKQNNWRVAEKEAALLIQRDSQAQKYLIARLRYIYLFSIAVQLEKKEVKYSDLKKKLSLVARQLVIQPWHPVKTNANPCFNLICADKDNPSVLVTAQANGNATQVYSFEYFDMGAPINVSSYNGQNARLGGLLEKIEINENLEKAEKTGSEVTWFFRLSVRDAFIDYER